MTLLCLAALVWLGVHLGLSGTRLRDRIVSGIGERAFPAVFSLLAVAALAFLIVAYDASGTDPLWYAPPWVVAVVDAIMLVATMLFVASVIPPKGAGSAPRGIFRVTRHPMLCSFGLWSAAHILATGDTASLVFFGTFLLTVLAGIPSLDAKLARRDPAKAASVQAVTSRVPFAAIVAGRNHLVAAEIGWLPPVVGVVAWAALIFLHPLVIGVSALPVR